MSSSAQLAIAARWLGPESLASRVLIKPYGHHGHFVKLVPDEQIVEVLEFETNDPSLRGEMTITTTLRDEAGGTSSVLGVHEGMPPGIAAADNETGWREALARLAALVERGRP